MNQEARNIMDDVDLFGDIDPDESWMRWDDPESRPAAWRAFGENATED